jgi:hypothetical protein
MGSEVFGQAEVDRVGIVVVEIDVGEIVGVGIIDGRGEAEQVEIAFGQ